MNMFLSCDWGTSSFRLRLVNVSHRRPMGEILSDEGIADTYGRWLRSCGPQGTDKKTFYLQQLKKSIDTLPDCDAVLTSDIPVIISGMAGSSIGIKELPYASLPFSVDGTDAIVQKLEASGDFPYRVWLISGVNSRLDVMRGEETQVVGLAGLSGDRPVFSDRTVCVFPGTHSKHIKVQNGKVIDFQTCITGELFHVMTNHSILKDSVSKPGDVSFDDAHRDAFRRGVRQSGENSLLNTLFTVRVNHLFRYLDTAENYFYLSGLLIGSEARRLLLAKDWRIMICGESKLHHLYEVAIEELGLLDRTDFVDPGRMDKVVIEGQIKIALNGTN